MYKELLKNIYNAYNYKRYDEKFLSHCNMLLQTIYLNKKDDDIYYLIHCLLIIKEYNTDKTYMKHKRIIMGDVFNYINKVIQFDIQKVYAKKMLLYFSRILNNLDQYEELVLLKACIILYEYCS